MALAIADRVRETTTTSGTGTVSLAGAVAGFQGFVAGIGNGNSCHYLLEDGDAWEVGVGTVTDASPDTLSRDTVIASSSGGSKITLSGGTVRVSNVMPGSKSHAREALGAIGGSVGTTDNEVPRANGTGGLTLQAGGGPVINDDGSLVNALQPAFLAFNSATDSNVTGTVATGLVDVDFDSEVFDQGGDFSSDTFTAPVSGKYLLTAAISITGITAAADLAMLRLQTSNRVYDTRFDKSNDIPSRMMLQCAVVADLDAGDTAYVRAQIHGEATDVCDIEGGINTTYFSGVLIT